MLGQIDIIGAAVACGIKDWWAFAGDPLVSGSVFMASYGLTAWLIFRVAVRTVGKERNYWWLCGWLFGFQVINVNADLHGLVFTVGRCLSRAQGWYEDRHVVQFYVLVGLALVALLIVLLILLSFFRNIVGNLLLTLGVGTAVGLTLVKGVNYHNLERYYAGSFGPFRGGDLIELSGIALAFLAAAWRLTRKGARDDDAWIGNIEADDRD